MQHLFSNIIGELVSIPVEALKISRDDIFFPKERYLPKAECQRKISGQFGTIRQLQDQLSSNATEKKNDERELARLNTLLAEKTKKCADLEKLVSSLEFALREETNRNKRKR